ncbi:MAG: L,D-transpeptidase family protein [Deltaproteobacteria bacterium]
MPTRPHPSPGAWLLLAALGASCAQAPPVPTAKETPPPPPPAVAAPAPCPIVQVAACDSPGECKVVEVIGEICHRIVLPGDSLIEMARQYDLGFNEIEAANPGQDAFVPKAGSTVTLPTSWIVPRAAAPGRVVVNLSEMRLFHFPQKPGPAMTFPVGIGTEGWATPVGTFKVIQKQVNPPWYPPASIRREEPDLPAMVPPGPDNPLGTHALRLSKGSILIHGTDTPFGVGRRASHGCLRLYPEDIPVLFERVPVGTEVRIVREPVKVGVRAGRVYVEIHPDDEAKVDLAAEARKLLAKRRLTGSVDGTKLAEALADPRGFPVDVTDDRT